jgi:hypothetical protein
MSLMSTSEHKERIHEIKHELDQLDIQIRHDEEDITKARTQCLPTLRGPLIPQSTSSDGKSREDTFQESKEKNLRSAMKGNVMNKKRNLDKCQKSMLELTQFSQEQNLKCEALQQTLLRA